MTQSDRQRVFTRVLAVTVRVTQTTEARIKWSRNDDSVLIRNDDSVLIYSRDLSVNGYRELVLGRQYEDKATMQPLFLFRTKSPLKALLE